MSLSPPLSHSSPCGFRLKEPRFSFFRYCAEHGSRHPRQEEQLPRYPKSPSPIPSTTSSDGEVELIHEYSARNFFSVINFVHILQKLTKRKLHRVLLLVQYKSSVSPHHDHEMCWTHLTSVLCRLSLSGC